MLFTECELTHTIIFTRVILRDIHYFLHTLTGFCAVCYTLYKSGDRLSVFNDNFSNKSISYPPPVQPYGHASIVRYLLTILWIHFFINSQIHSSSICIYSSTTWMYSTTTTTVNTRHLMTHSTDISNFHNITNTLDVLD